MRMRVLRENLRVEIENETRVFLESLNFKIDESIAEVCHSGRKMDEIPKPPEK